MLRYVGKRLLWAIVVLWAIITITFGATFLSPIDPARSYAGQRATKQQIERVREQFGLNDPIYVRYGRYLWRTVQGDLGDSYEYSAPVRTLVFDALPQTALLALAAIIVQAGLGLPLGMIAALRRGFALDRGILAFSLLGVVVPSFVLGFVLLYVFAFKLGWFPLGGSGSFSSLVLPAVTLGVAGAAWYARILRSTVLNITSEDYVRFARAKGLPERLVVGRHILRNAISPLITMIALDFGVFLGGVLVIEKVFAWPGVGLQAWQAIQFNDIPMVMGTVLVAAFFITMFNLVADVVNAFVDPRIRYA